jgi:hypothetical protein
VRDDEDAPVAGMSLGDPPERAQDPRLMCLRRLADELDPVALDGGEAFPRTPVLLPQVRIEHDRQPEPLGNVSAVSRARERSLE